MRDASVAHETARRGRLGKDPSRSEWNQMDGRGPITVAFQLLGCGVHRRPCERTCRPYSFVCRSLCVVCLPSCYGHANVAIAISRTVPSMSFVFILYDQRKISIDRAG